MEGFSEEMTFEHKQQMMRQVNSEKIWGRSILGTWEQEI